MKKEEDEPQNGGRTVWEHLQYIRELCRFYENGGKVL